MLEHIQRRAAKMVMNEEQLRDLRVLSLEEAEAGLYCSIQLSEERLQAMVSLLPCVK